MITRSLRLQQPPLWQTLLSQAITDPQQLLLELGLPQNLLPAAAQASAAFKLRVPRGFLARMRQGDPHDPLLKQILAEYSATGLPPAYLPKNPSGKKQEKGGAS